MKNIFRYLFNSIKRFIFIGDHVSIGKRLHIGIFSFVSASDKLIIGDDVYIGKFCSIQVNGRIGDGVLIANNVGLVGRRDHDMRSIGTSVRLSPWVGENVELATDPCNALEVGPDVWIGYGSVVLSGVKIGRGAIIAAGSVVISDVKSYDIVSGNPARPVGRRFSADKISEHEKILCGVKL